MLVKFKYNEIIKYEVIAVCTQPLHVGSAVGDKEEVLIHPVDDIPFIQATSIAGVFRNYYEKIDETPSVKRILLPLSTLLSSASSLSLFSISPNTILADVSSIFS